MEIEILKEKLNKGLGVIEPITKRNTNLPILSNVLLEAEKNFLKIKATNLESSIIWRILSNVKKGGNVCVPVSFFSSLIGFIKEEKVVLKTENNNLIVENNEQMNQIQGVNPDDFPIIPKITKGDVVKLNSGVLNQALINVVNIPSVSQVRPEISGIYFSFKKNDLKIVATDSFRLAEKTINLEEKIEKECSFIIPQAVVRELINVLSSKQGEVGLYFNPNQVLFEWFDEELSFPQIDFSSRLIEGEYPNYQEIIPKKYTYRFSVNREEFLIQIKKAGLFSGKISEVKIIIIPQKNKIKIFSQSPNVGRSEAYMGVKIENAENEDIENSFNYRFLIDGLASIKSSEIVFGISKKDGPATITPVGDDSFIYILMPIKSA